MCLYFICFINLLFLYRIVKSAIGRNITRQSFIIGTLSVHSVISWDKDSQPQVTLKACYANVVDIELEKSGICWLLSGNEWHLLFPWNLIGRFTDVSPSAGTHYGSARISRYLTIKHAPNMQNECSWKHWNAVYWASITADTIDLTVEQVICYKMLLAWHAFFNSQSNAIMYTMLQSNGLKSMTFWTPIFWLTPMSWFLLY